MDPTQSVRQLIALTLWGFICWSFLTICGHAFSFATHEGVRGHNKCEKRCEHAWSKRSPLRVHVHTQTVFLLSFFCGLDGKSLYAVPGHKKKKERQFDFSFPLFFFPLSAPISSLYFYISCDGADKEKKRSERKSESQCGRSTTSWSAYRCSAHMLWFQGTISLLSLCCWPITIPWPFMVASA